MIAIVAMDGTTVTSHNYHFVFCGWNNDIYFSISRFIFHILLKSKENKYFIMSVDAIQVPESGGHILPWLTFTQKAG